MAVLNIVKVGENDEVLRQRAQEVTKVTKKIQKLIKDMIETMYEADGVGLAAPQIGVSKRIIVVDIGEGPIALINPKIIEMSPEQEIDVEGCLSILEFQGYVKRAKHVVVQGLDEKEKIVKIEASDFLARAFQHELDHLDGILFTDKIEEKEGD